MALLQILGLALAAAEQGRLPDAAIHFGIRRMLKQRRRGLLAGDCESQQRRRKDFIALCRQEPIAALPEKANEQHYEVPADFFRHVLGTHRKYSCCFWNDGVSDIDAAEAAALALTCERAQLRDGQRVLELGCGWGSLSLWMASRYPDSHITAVSNSLPQREFIEQQAQMRNISNLTVLTADMNTFSPDEAFDRVVSVEMFEHMRNHQELLRRISTWLRPDGLLFVHVFCHRSVPYFFETAGDGDWMARHFFSGGVMPSDDLLLQYQSNLTIKDHWRLNGQHYTRTSHAWLRRMDQNRAVINPILEETYGEDSVALWRQRWRIFFMACAELFAYRDGNERWVSHYLYEK